MSLDGKLYVPQPYLPYIDLEINGELIVSRTLRPEFFESFEYKRSVNNQSNSFTFNLFDQRWDILMEKIERAQAKESKIEFRYYYVGSDGNIGLTSPWFSGTILEWTPELTSAGIRLEITGESHVMTRGATSSKRKVWRKKHVSDIVKEIVDSHADDGWYYTTASAAEEAKRAGAVFTGNDSIEVTNDLPSMDGHKGTELVLKEFRQSDMSDLKFLKTVLLEHANSADEEKGGYRIWFDDYDVSVDKGRKPGMRTTRVNFRRIETEHGAEAGRVYEYMRNDRDSEVLSFAPQIKGSTAQFGAASKKTQAIDAYGNRPVDVLDKELDQDFIDTVLTLPDNYVADHHGADTRKVPQNVHIARAKTKNERMKWKPDGFKASAVLVGDPTLQVQEIIRVEIWAADENGYPTYPMSLFTGNYQIDGITDNISEGSFTSDLDLQRVPPFS